MNGLLFDLSVGVVLDILFLDLMEVHVILSSDVVGVGAVKGGGPPAVKVGNVLDIEADSAHNSFVVCRIFPVVGGVQEVTVTVDLSLDFGVAREHPLASELQGVGVCPLGLDIFFAVGDAFIKALLGDTIGEELAATVAFNLEHFEALGDSNISVRGVEVLSCASHLFDY